MKADVPMQYRLVEVRAHNVKALKAVAIRIDGRPVFKISGRNGQGKSSVLDAVAMAIAGPAAFPEKPIRAGESEAEIFLDFTDLKLTRKIFAKEDGKGVTHTLKLDFRDGKKPKEKQTVLDALRGSPIADDPLEFATLKPKERFDLLKQLVPDFDFESHAESRRELFEERTQVGRDRDRAIGAASSIEVPADAPLDVPDASELVEKIEAMRQRNSAIARARSIRETEADEIDRMRDELETLGARIRELNTAIAEKEQALADCKPLPDEEDVGPVQEQLRNISHLQALATRRREKAQREAEAKGLSSKYDLLTSEIADLDKQKVDAIANAKLPIPALTFGDGDILLDGLPFDQASTARKIRVSTALLMALKPELRVLLVREGSLLDDDAREALEADAKEHGFVVLMECVGDDVDGGGVVIENGEVADNG